MSNGTASLYFSVQSGNSESTLVSLTDKTRALDKETQLLAQATSNLAKANKQLLENQTRLQTELKSSQQTVNDLQKAYDKYGDELSKSRLDKAIENHAKLKQELTEVNTQLNANQRTYKDYLEVVRKGSTGDGGGIPDGLKGSNWGVLWSGLGVGKQLADLAEQWGSGLLDSAFGSDTGGVLSSALSSAISGAFMGTAIGGAGIGTAAGALIGGTLGAISGAIGKQSNKDDAFKDYYGGLYEDVKGRSGEMVEAGSAIAGGREQTHMAFARRLGGDEAADDYLKQVETMAAKTNYDYDEIVGYAKLLLNSYDPDEVFGVLRDLSDATAGLDLSSSDVNMMISGLSRMRTTGKATQEYLNYFRERGVDVDAALADSLGVDKSAVFGMVSKGQISGDDAAQAILEFIQTQFGGLSDDLAGTYDAMVDNLADMTSTIQAYGGDAYNELRKEGVDAQMSAYEGELGDALKEINSIMGETQARKENLQDQYMREVLDAVLNKNYEGELWGTFNWEQQADLMEMSQKYADAMERYEKGDKYAGAELEAIYEEAQGLGQAYFENSEFMKKLNDVELDEITALRDNTAKLDEATQAAYRLSQELSKGYGASITGWGIPNWDVRSENALKAAGLTPEGIEAMQSAAYSANSHAFGLDRVPYDGYPALLHEGERVLTASQARTEDAAQGGSPISVTITGNSFTGTPEEMADQLAEILVQRLIQAATAAAPQ